MWLHDHPGSQEASWLRCDMHRAEKSSQGCIIGREPVLGLTESQLLEACIGYGVPNEGGGRGGDVVQDVSAGCGANPIVTLNQGG